MSRITKPYLPIAAGELSVPAAWLLCGLLAAGGVSLVASNFGPLITKLYSLGLGLGTLYSVPPFRLRRFPIPAFIIIATVSQGDMWQHELGRHSAWPDAS